jgi:hypothetical protein
VSNSLQQEQEAQAWKRNHVNLEELPAVEAQQWGLALPKKREDCINKRFKMKKVSNKQK